MLDTILAFIIYILTLNVFTKGDYFYLNFRRCSLIKKFIDLTFILKFFNFVFFKFKLNNLVNKIPHIISSKNFYELFFARFLIQRKKFISFSDYLWFHILTQGVVILFFNFINITLKTYFEELNFKKFNNIYKFSAYSFIFIQVLFIISLIFGKLILKFLFILSLIYKTMCESQKYSIDTNKLKDIFYEKN